MPVNRSPGLDTSADHPRMVFRDGPTGRRAGLVAGPDVWEVIRAVRVSGLSGEAAVNAVADWAGLTRADVRAAIRCYAESPTDIDERIRRNVDEADEAEAAWRRESNPLA